jgi:2,3-bisphosphoglycerate-independent phosphoglycerate mutase
MDLIAARGQTGLAKTYLMVFLQGSDVANMSILDMTRNYIPGRLLGSGVWGCS